MAKLIESVSKKDVTWIKDGCKPDVYGVLSEGCLYLGILNGVSSYKLTTILGSREMNMSFYCYSPAGSEREVEAELSRIVSLIELGVEHGAQRVYMRFPDERIQSVVKIPVEDISSLESENGGRRFTFALEE